MMTPEQYSAPFNQPCHYCGTVVSGRNLHRDHFNAKANGGNSLLPNLVYACGSCNSTKGRRTVEESRSALIQCRLKWPKFSTVQLVWLRQQGFDMSPLDEGMLAFEEILQR